MMAGDIAKTFEQAWPTTTRHLHILEAAGLLQHEREGRMRRYRIDCKRLAIVRDWLAWFTKSHFKNQGDKHECTEENRNRRLEGSR